MPFGVPRSKTAVPDLPPWFVRRVPLLAALDRGAASALTLVCAPPGYGKTVLLADWVRGSGSPSAWVTVDEDDDDERLWAAVLAAVTTCPAVPPSSRLHRVVVAPGAVGPDVTSEVLGALEDLPVPIVLVIDDAHHLAGTQVLHTLHRVLRSRRARLRLVLAGRSDPALPVARLRLEDRLCELRAEQLAFSSENTTNLLEGCGVRLTPPQTELLHARTGGWAAGLRLAVLSLQDHPDPDRFLASFSGDERPVADYLVGEVLSRMAEDELTLLRWSSISDPLPPALAGHLSGDVDAAGVLARLERDTGLVVGSGSHRTEYRVQELLRSYLSADLHRRGPALEERLHRQAAEWWDAEDRPVEALFHAARVGDESFRTQLLHRWAADLIGRGQHAELRRARGPDAGERTDPDPWTPLVEAQEHLAHGDRAAASDVLSRSPAGNPTGDPGSAYLRVATERLAGIGSPVAPDEPTPDDPALSALTLAGRGAARLFASDPATADVQADLTGALRLARSRHLAFLELQCLCLLAAAALTAGDHRCASAVADEAIAAARGHGWEKQPWTAGAHAVLALAALTRARPSDVFSAAAAGLRTGTHGQDPAIRFALRSARGGAMYDTGERPAGLLELQQARAELSDAPSPAPLVATAALLEHRAAVSLGHPVAAAAAVGGLAARGVAGPELRLMRAWSAAGVGEDGRARAAIAPVLTGAERPLLPSTVVEAWLVEAWAAQRAGDHPTARRAVQTALEVAEPLDALRPFALAGREVRTLLVDQLGGAGAPSAFATSAAAAPFRERHPSDARLSSRERDVLARLTSLSNLGEIADDLDVSVNTIKSHVRAIYGKLGVSTRRTAVLVAHEQRLLS